MRDLANQSYSSGRANKSSLFKIAIALGVAFGLFYLTTNFLKIGSSGGSSSIKLTEAPRGLKAVEIEGSMQDLKGGVDLKSQTIKLKLVKGDFSGSATATRSFGGDIYALTVDAVLQDPIGQNYAVWLVGDGGPVLIDYMKGTKNNWNLSVRTSDKYSSMHEIWLTLERVKDAKPEEHLLEGSF